ncbi:hypothetical protein D4764_0165740 [Takifugu flavidus]|uniref:Uncharacterized protein n=1 Tax=Takifugu flavidus TaxID=433684 RepID=A0A5C6ME63_9TELE|nr:hypothetical protein D4764_0165740 [Takifugu flavidus]
MAMTWFADSKIASIEPLVNHFCERMSEEQWQLLKSGAPDAASRIQIAELVLGMIKVLTTNVLTALEHLKLHRSEEELLDSLNEVITQISHQTLSFPDRMDSVQSKCLTTLITKEVSESITSSLCESSSSSSLLELKHRIVNPYRLNAMVTHAANMFNNMKIKMKALFVRRRLVRLSDGQDVPEPPEKDDRRDESSRTAASLRSTMSESLHGEIRNVASGIVTPLTDDLPNEDFEKLLSEISEEAQNLSEAIGAALSPKTSNRLCKNIKLKIRNFFTNCIAKVWRRRMLEQLKDTHEPQSPSAGHELLEALVENVSSQLQVCIHRDEEPAGESSETLCYSAAIDDVNAFIEELYSMVDHYFKGEVAKAQAEQLSVAMTRDVCSDLQHKVWTFVALINWWLTTQVTSISEQVTLTDEEEVAGLRGAPEEGEDRAGGTAHITQETLLYHLIDNILLRIYEKTHLYAQNRHDLHNRLFEVVGSNVKKEAATVSIQMANNIGGRISGELRRRWGGEHNVVTLLNLDSPVVDMCFVSVFKHQLTKPP